MTKSLAGRKEKQRRVGDTEKASEKEASNRVGRNDRLGYGWEEVEAREWGGGQKVQKVAQKGGHFGPRSIGIRSIAFADRNASWPKPLFALLAQSLIMIGSLSLLAASSPESLWKGWRYGECKKWKRLDSQMGSQSSDGHGDQGQDFEI